MSKPTQPFKIDAEFKAMMVPLSGQAESQLLISLKREGCLDPLVVWKEEGLLLDGHNRERLCRQRGVKYAIKEISLPDREAARAWIRDNQVGRRNLTPEGYSYLRGKHYNEQKQAHGGARNSQNGDGKKTEDVLAELYKVSAKTIRNDAKFANALDKMVEIDKNQEQFKIALLQGEIKITRGQVIKLAKMDVQDQFDIAGKAVMSGKYPRKTAAKKAKTITLPTAPKAFAERLLEVRGEGYLRQLQQALEKALEERSKKKALKG